MTNHLADAERQWEIQGPVLRIRIHGDSEALDLSGPIVAPMIGAADACHWKLRDPSDCVSQHHAQLSRHGSTWTMHDLDSTNGLFRNRERLSSFELRPGDEIEMGGMLLIAESQASIVLHSFLARLIGWSHEQRTAVDRAQRCVRDMSQLRSALVIAGADPKDLLLIARRIHELTIGGRPFVTATANLPASITRAATGTLCVSVSELPEDFAAVAEQLTAVKSRVRLIICCRERVRTEARANISKLLGRASASLRVDLLDLPPIEERGGDSARLITEFAEDIAIRQGFARAPLREHEQEWLRDLRFDSFVNLEKFARRLVALRNRGVTAGARELRVTHTALSQWARRHGIPT